MSFVVDLLGAVWSLLLEMAPWLLIGFIFAGILGQFLPESFIEKHLKQPGLGSILKAIAIGAPMPLCSCGVIPVATQLRRSGASKGAVAAFTVSTPQTGVDSIAATYSLMGWPFTLGRLAADLMSGLIAGLSINRWDRSDKAAPFPVTSCCQGEQCDEDDASNPSTPSALSRLKSALRHGLIDLPNDIGPNLVWGLLIGAALTVWIPQSWSESLAGTQWVQYAAVSLVAIPMYVCATGSIPLAYGLVAAGLSPGAAIVFLVTGPATNTATVSALLKLLGRKSTGLYLASLAVSAWTIAAIFDSASFELAGGQAHEMAEHGPISILSAIVVMGILARPLWIALRNPFTDASDSNCR